MPIYLESKFPYDLCFCYLIYLIILLEKKLINPFKLKQNLHSLQAGNCFYNSRLVVDVTDLINLPHIVQTVS